MKTSTITFDQNVRCVYTGTKAALNKCGIFKHIRANEAQFRISASHGLPIFGEDIIVKVVATGTKSCKVEIKSSDKLLFNIFKWGNNIRNVDDLVDFIQNEIYKYVSPEELGLKF